MEYEVFEERYIQELGVWLMPGDVFADGDCEPDLVADLLARGVIARVGEEPVAVVVPDSEEEKPKSKSKKAETDVADGVG